MCRRTIGSTPFWKKILIESIVVCLMILCLVWSGLEGATQKPLASNSERHPDWPTGNPFRNNWPPLPIVKHKRAMAARQWYSRRKNLLSSILWNFRNETKGIFHLPINCSAFDILNGNFLVFFALDGIFYQRKTNVDNKNQRLFCFGVTQWQINANGLWHTPALESIRANVEGSKMATFSDSPIGRFSKLLPLLGWMSKLKEVFLNVKRRFEMNVWSWNFLHEDSGEKYQ